jgi:hypothetical protein
LDLLPVAAARALAEPEKFEGDAAAGDVEGDVFDVHGIKPMNSLVFA